MIDVLSSKHYKIYQQKLVQYNAIYKQVYAHITAAHNNYYSEKEIKKNENNITKETKYVIESQ